MSFASNDDYDHLVFLTVFLKNVPKADKGSSRRGAVVKGVEDISANLLVNTTSEWRGSESRWFCWSGFEFAKTPISILNHEHCGSISCPLIL